MSDMVKVCTKCGEKKLACEFFADKAKKDGLSSSCKECINEYQRQYRKTKKHKKWFRKFMKTDQYKNKSRKYWGKNKDKIRNRRIARVFGITTKDYDLMLESQGNRCAICDNSQNGRRFDIDHNHITGKVRGLLCVKCNIGIGLFDSDENGSEILKKAVKYIEGAP